MKMNENLYENKFSLSLKKYPLSLEQKAMLENLISMFRSGDPDIINLARQLVINKPLLNIIVGTPYNRASAKTLHNRVRHCKFKRYRGFEDYSLSSVCKVTDEYYSMTFAIEATIKNEFYYLYD